MNDWIGNKSGWLAGVAKKKQTVDIPLQENKINQTNDVVITRILLRCPYCRSEKIKCYGVDKPLKYYRCITCKRKFKVIEKEIPV